MEAPRIKEFAEELWLVEGPVIRFTPPPFPLALPYALRSAVVRLKDGGLWVHSPVQLSTPLRKRIESLGPVRHLVSPNKLHHLYLDQWVQAFPEARLWAPPGLAEKRPDLEFSGLLADTAVLPWAEEVQPLMVEGSVFMDEVVFLHHASRTLILGDLIANHDPAPMSGPQRWVARANRSLAPHGQTPLNYRLTFMRRDLTRAAVRQIFSWDAEQLVMAHGVCVRKDVQGFLGRGLAWLEA